MRGQADPEKKWRNPEFLREYRRKWRAEHLEQIRAYKREYMRKYRELYGPDSMLPKEGK